MKDKKTNVEALRVQATKENMLLELVDEDLEAINLLQSMGNVYPPPIS